MQGSYIGFVGCKVQRLRTARRFKDPNNRVLGPKYSNMHGI